MVNGYRIILLDRTHNLICEFLNCDKESVRGVAVLRFLKRKRKFFMPCCPLCGSLFRFVEYTDARTGFICKGCKASGTNYVGGF